VGVFFCKILLTVILTNKVTKISEEKGINVLDKPGIFPT